MPVEALRVINEQRPGEVAADINMLARWRKQLNFRAACGRGVVLLRRGSNHTQRARCVAAAACGISTAARENVSFLS